MVRLLLASSLLAASLAAPAGAQPKSPPPEEAPAAAGSVWDLARTPGTCMLHASSARGTILSIWSFAGQDKFAFLLQNPGWESLREGAGYDLELDFLGVRSMPVRATARRGLDSDGPGYFFTVAPGGRQPGAGLIDALVSARGLEISRDGATVDRLKLDGSREAMAGMARCTADLWTADAPVAELEKADVEVPVMPTV